MNNFKRLSGPLLIFIPLVILAFGCQSDAEQVSKFSVAAPLEASMSRKNAPSSEPEEAPEERWVAPVVEKSKIQYGLIRDNADFWLGLPNERNSMPYLKLDPGIEVKVLGQAEGYYKVAHRDVIGYVKVDIVNIMETAHSGRVRRQGKTSVDIPKSTDGNSAPAHQAKSSSPAYTSCTGGITEDLFPGVSCVQYRTKVQEKVATLENHIKRIIDKSEISREKSVDQACRLFVNEQARVYTSSLNEAGRSRLVRKYLNGLMELSYDRVEIEWTNIQYVSELRKGPDGKYFGFVHIEQRFEGFLDDRLVYGDITEKKITVVLEAYEVIDEWGDTNTRWDVFLSDIGVEQTQKI